MTYSGSDIIVFISHSTTMVIPVLLKTKYAHSGHAISHLVSVGIIYKAYAQISHAIAKINTTELNFYYL